MAVKRGDLIRWVVDWGIYTVSPDGHAQGEYPQYCHGIVMEISEKQSDAAVIYCYDCKNEGQWTILHILHDKFEILSGDK
tara:strand:- start:335 stop:574 length:240 start_codon:yes stop_codon:yes gene_type:complete